MDTVNVNKNLLDAIKHQDAIISELNKYNNCPEHVKVCDMIIATLGQLILTND